MSASVVVIGLDAAEPTLIERWAAEGELPTFAQLQTQGAVARLSNSLETLPGAIWPELATGVSGGRLGLFYHPAQIHTGEAAARPVAEEDVDGDAYFWSVASDGGRRVAVVDIPQTAAPSELNGLQVFEWGLHDRNYEIRSRPPGLIDEIRSRYGDHPVVSCDEFHGRTVDGYAALRAALLEGAARKTELLLDLLGRDEWDLFACVFGETHCIGHQLWHFLDDRHPLHDPDAPAELRNGILDVYRAVDRGVAAVIEAAGPDARILVVASHGMDMEIGGPQLLSEVLVRLGLGRSAGWRLRARNAIPRSVRTQISRVIPRQALDASGVGVGFASKSLDHPSVKAIAVQNNRCGAIRLNIAGREPFGSIQPGREVDELVARIERELLALRQPSSGEPIVERVVTSEAVFGPDRNPDVPDILVVFRTDLGQLEACESPSVGLVEAPIMVPHLPRTGDHTVESRLWAMGPGIEPGVYPEGNVLDLAPTVLELLDVAPPDGVDGRSLVRSWTPRR